MLGLGNHPCEACLWRANFAYGGFWGINLDGDAMILKLAWSAGYSLKNTSGFPATCLLASACTKGDIEMNTETSHN